MCARAWSHAEGGHRKRTGEHNEPVSAEAGAPAEQRNARPEVVVELVETTTSGCAQIFLIFLKSSEGFYHQYNCEQENYKVCNQLSIEDALYSKACNMWQNYNERQEENKLSCEGEN